MNKRFHWDFWAGVTLLSIAVFALFLIYPLFSLFVSAFQDWCLEHAELRALL